MVNMMKQIPNVRHVALAAILGSAGGVGYKYLREDPRFRKQFILCTSCAGVAGLAYGFIGARIGKVPFVKVTTVGNGINGAFMSALFLSIRKFMLEDHPIKEKVKVLLENSLATDISPLTIHPVPAAVISGSITGATYSMFMWSGVFNLGVNVLLGAALGGGAHFVYNGLHLLFLEMAVRYHHPEVVKFPETVKKETWDEWIVRMAAKKTPVGELQSKITDLEIEYLNLKDKENELLGKMKQVAQEDQTETSQNITGTSQIKTESSQLKTDTANVNTQGTLLTNL